MSNQTQDLVQAGKGESSGSCTCGSDCGGTCPACVAAAKRDRFVYAIGHLRPTIPNLGLEKEISQAVGQRFDEAISNQEALHALLTSAEFSYLADEVCWVYRIGVADAFVVKTSTHALDSIRQTMRPNKSWDDVDVVIGRTVGQTTSHECNGRNLPTVEVSQIYSFSQEKFIERLFESGALKSTKREIEAAFRQTTETIRSLAGNFGLSEGHRALNYLLVRCWELYETVASQLVEGSPLDGISMRPSSIGTDRRVIDVVLQFRSRKTDFINRHVAQVDVTDLYPFLVAPIRPFVSVG